MKFYNWPNIKVELHEIHLCLLNKIIFWFLKKGNNKSVYLALSNHNKQTKCNIE